METKKCNRCLEEKSLNDFYSQNKFSNKKGNYIYYQPFCKECTKDKFRQWREENPERYRELKRQENQRPHRKKKLREYDKKRKEAGKYLNWLRNNKDKVKKYNDKRIDKNHKITNEEWEICKQYFDNSCAYCGMSDNEQKEKYGTQLHKEHVDHEGSNDLSNCVPSCKSCNSSKHIFPLDEWYNDNNENYTEERYNRIANWVLLDYRSAAM